MVLRTGHRYIVSIDVLRNIKNNDIRVINGRAMSKKVIEVKNEHRREEFELNMNANESKCNGVKPLHTPKRRHLGLAPRH